MNVQLWNGCWLTFWLSKWDGPLIFLDDHWTIHFDGPFDHHCGEIPPTEAPLWGYMNEKWRKDVDHYPTESYSPKVCKFLQLENPFMLYPSNAEATSVQSKRTKSFLKNIQTLLCWYSLASSPWVLPGEYPFARVSIIFVMLFASFCIGQISHQQHKDYVTMDF